MKYDRIITIRPENSKRKTEIAKREIQNMLERKEKISVTALAKKTGFSRALFYDNPEVRKTLDDALRKQGACYNPKQIIIDKVMEDKLITLKMTVTKLKKENIKLLLENEKLLKENNLLKRQLER